MLELLICCNRLHKWKEKKYSTPSFSSYLECSYLYFDANTLDFFEYDFSHFSGDSHWTSTSPGGYTFCLRRDTIEEKKSSLKDRIFNSSPKVAYNRIFGVYEHLYVVKETDENGNRRYYEPFTKMEFIYSERYVDSIITIPGVDSSIWSRVPFQMYIGDGAGWEGDCPTINPRSAEDEPKFEHFKELKNNELYQKAIPAYFQKLREQSASLPPRTPPRNNVEEYLKSL